jgi:predicted extracellular nuclease
VATVGGIGSAAARMLRAGASAPTSAAQPGVITVRVPAVAVGALAVGATAGLAWWLLRGRNQGGADPAVPTEQPKPLPAPSTVDVRLGQLNVRNLFDLVDDPRKQDVVPDPAAHELHLRKLALTLRDTMGAPDVVALQEVENIEVLRTLASRPELAGLGYEPILLEGRDPRGIDVAMLYRADRVRPTSIQAWDPDGVSATGRKVKTFTRPPLVVRFEPTSTGDARAGAFDVVSAHLTSRLQGDDGERRRAQQASALADAIDGARLADPRTPLLLAGDLNMTPEEAPYLQLVARDAAGGARLLEPLLGITEGERHSYRRGSVRELLDHVLVTPDPSVVVGGARILHVNTTAGAALARNPDVPDGASDHDPIVLELALGSRG